MIFSLLLLPRCVAMHASLLYGSLLAPPLLSQSVWEGRAAGSKDLLFKYTILLPSSFSQKLKTNGDDSTSMHKGKGSTTSASNMSYTVNWAAAEDVWRQTTTPLPFHRNSLFSYLRSNPAIHSALAGSSATPIHLSGGERKRLKAVRWRAAPFFRS
jgi:hypothetical protein